MTWCVYSSPDLFWAIGQFYEDFTQVEDEQVVALLRQAARNWGLVEPAGRQGLSRLREPADW
jgi:predicted phosphoribosyltransferase